MLLNRLPFKADQIRWCPSSPFASPIWYADALADFSQIALDSAAETPIYKQLADGIRALLDHGVIQSGQSYQPLVNWLAFLD